jgi:Protein of unknown function (DUF2752)
MARSLPRRIVTHIGATLDAARLPAAHRLGDAGLMTAGVGAAAVAARALSVPLSCPMLALTGIPCPGCGMTRLADGLAHGHVIDALGTDPMGALVVTIIGALAVVGVARRAGLGWSLPAGSTRAVPALLVAVLALRWVAVLAGVGPAVS